MTFNMHAHAVLSPMQDVDCSACYESVVPVIESYAVVMLVLPVRVGASANIQHMPSSFRKRSRRQHVPSSIPAQAAELHTGLDHHAVMASKDTYMEATLQDSKAGKSTCIKHADITMPDPLWQAYGNR